LLGVYDFDSTAKQREDMRRMKMLDYKRVKGQWTSISDEQASM
jgi:hypothetical protein